MTISLACSARAATSAPPSTRYGDLSSSIRSLALPGSPSVALTRTTTRFLRWRADCITDLQLPAERERRAAAAAKVDLLGGI